MKTRMTKIGWLLVVSIVSTASVAVAENRVAGYLHQTYPSPGYLDTSAITNIGPATGNWDIPVGSASAHTDYGNNQVSLSCFFENPIAVYQDFVNVESEWADTLVITGGSGTNNAVFRFNVHSDAAHGGGQTFLTWEVRINAWDSWAGEWLPNYTNFNRTVDFPVQFVYGQPFVMHGVTSAQSQGSNAHALVEMQLTNILLPPGAIIGSASGVNWNTKTAVVTTPSLSISPSGTNVLLHWFAFSDYILETTTNLSSGTVWKQVTDYVPVTTGSIEYTLTHPMDVPARFFRLRKLTP